ncbi:MAG: hypothetical protein Q4D39_00120 [Coriobacteriaceae bacterium]|nr:hypothetical protein [Coriobacteriaceae bacterium]
MRIEKRISTKSVQDLRALSDDLEYSLREMEEEFDRLQDALFENDGIRGVPFFNLIAEVIEETERNLSGSREPVEQLTGRLEELASEIQELLESLESIHKNGSLNPAALNPTS